MQRGSAPSRRRRVSSWDEWSALLRDGAAAAAPAAGTGAPAQAQTAQALRGGPGGSAAARRGKGSPAQAGTRGSSQPAGAGAGVGAAAASKSQLGGARGSSPSSGSSRPRWWASATRPEAESPRRAEQLLDAYTDSDDSDDTGDALLVYDRSRPSQIWSARSPQSAAARRDPATLLVATLSGGGAEEGAEEGGAGGWEALYRALDAGVRGLWSPEPSALLASALPLTEERSEELPERLPDPTELEALAREVASLNADNVVRLCRLRHLRGEADEAAAGAAVAGAASAPPARRRAPASSKIDTGGRPALGSLVYHLQRSPRLLVSVLAAAERAERGAAARCARSVVVGLLDPFCSPERRLLELVAQMAHAVQGGVLPAEALRETLAAAVRRPEARQPLVQCAGLRSAESVMMLATAAAPEGVVRLAQLLAALALDSALPRGCEPARLVLELWLAPALAALGDSELAGLVGALGDELASRDALGVLFEDRTNNHSNNYFSNNNSDAAGEDGATGEQADAQSRKVVAGGQRLLRRLLSRKVPEAPEPAVEGLCPLVALRGDAIEALTSAAAAFAHEVRGRGLAQTLAPADAALVSRFAYLAAGLACSGAAATAAAVPAAATAAATASSSAAAAGRGRSTGETWFVFCAYDPACADAPLQLAERAALRCAVVRNVASRVEEAMGREALLRGDATRAALARQHELRQLSSELEGFHGEGLLLVHFLAAARATLAFQVSTRDWLQAAVAVAERDEAGQQRLRQAQQRAAEPEPAQPAEQGDAEEGFTDADEGSEVDESERLEERDAEAVVHDCLAEMQARALEATERVHRARDGRLCSKARLCHFLLNEDRSAVLVGDAGGARDSSGKLLRDAIPVASIQGAGMGLPNPRWPGASHGEAAVLGCCFYLCLSSGRTVQLAAGSERAALTWVFGLQQIAGAGPLRGRRLSPEAYLRRRAGFLERRRSSLSQHSLQALARDAAQPEQHDDDDDDDAERAAHVKAGSLRRLWGGAPDEPAAGSARGLEAAAESVEARDRRRSSILATAEQVQSLQITALVGLCGVDADTARAYLEKNAWDLEQAAGSFYDAGAGGYFTFTTE